MDVCTELRLTPSEFAELAIAAQDQAGDVRVKERDGWLFRHPAGRENETIAGEFLRRLVSQRHSMDSILDDLESLNDGGNEWEISESGKGWQ